MLRKWRRNNQTWSTLCIAGACLMGLDLQWHWSSSTLPMFWGQKTLHLQFRTGRCDFQDAQMVFLKLLVFSHASCICKVQNPPALSRSPGLQWTKPALCSRGRVGQWWEKGAERGAPGRAQHGTNPVCLSPGRIRTEIQTFLDMIDCKAHWLLSFN